MELLRQGPFSTSGVTCGSFSLSTSCKDCTTCVVQQDSGRSSGLDFGDGGMRGSFRRGDLACLGQQQLQRWNNKTLIRHFDKAAAPWRHGDCHVRKERFEELEEEVVRREAPAAVESYEEDMTVLVSDLKGFTSTVRKHGSGPSLGSTHLMWSARQDVKRLGS